MIIIIDEFLDKGKNMNKTLDPKSYEKDIYSMWLDKGYFKANVNKDKSPFTIIMPPPNITSKLHIGHAYTTTLQDTIIRYKRMQGYEALLLPGTDHAALATEVKVVEKLKKEGKTKEMLGRKAFLEEMQKWYHQYGSLILEQFKQMGVSCDWNRLAFTMDEDRQKSVRYAFKHLYDKGLIYQGDRITNWCCSCHTALSNIEVEYEDHHGYIYHIKYPFQDGSGYIVVATTRPETLMGDVAVAVNPTDERYAGIVGKMLDLPLVHRAIPIIADAYVDKEFGTGMVKITPAHDPNDYEVGKRHHLPMIQTINLDGTMNENAGAEYCGLDRFACREKVVEDLKNLELIEKIEKYDNKVGHCQRCHSVIEPMLSKQWYVRMKELAKPAIDVVKDGQLKFVPKRFENLYLSWMENIDDWCISRQLWSGHRIPVFTCEDCGQKIVELEDPTVCPHCGSTHLTQDEDALDTWFSSALWPFSTLGWPNKTEDLAYFYPTSLMITAYDIIFFWVARMIFSGLEYMGQIPFKEVLMHGLVRDNLGRKMSKSLGNGIDPVEMIEKYGTDALRYSLVMGTAIGMDAKFGMEKIETSRNFLNKLWNASRFVLESLKQADFVLKDIHTIALDVLDEYILTELSHTIEEVEKSYEKYDLSVVASSIYEFVWTKFCDWYIEGIKPKLYSNDPQIRNDTINILVYILDKILKLLHPICPFVTEEIYQNLPNHGPSIMIDSFPHIDKELLFVDHRDIIEDLMEAIRGVRNIRAEMNVADNIRTNIYIEILDAEEIINSVLYAIPKLAFGKEICKGKCDNAKMIVAKHVKLYLPVDDMVDKEAEILRLTKELEKIDKEIARSKSMLNNAGFVAKAPQQLVDAEKEKLQQHEEHRKTIISSIDAMKK